MIDYFLHIPKTGGTSLTNTIDSYYQPSEILPYQLTMDLKRNWPVDITNIKLVRGHFGYGLYHIFGRDNMRYFTVFRNPVDRVISAYKHITMDYYSNRWLYPYPYIDDMNEMVFKYPSVFANAAILSITHNRNPIEPKLAKQIINTMIGVADTDRIASEDSIKDFESKNWQNLFNKACENLDTFCFVLFLENFQQSFDKLCGIMDWKKRKISYNNKSVIKKPIILKQDTIEQINRITYWDQKLYEYAQKRWN